MPEKKTEWNMSGNWHGIKNKFDYIKLIKFLPMLKLINYGEKIKEFLPGILNNENFI